MKVLSGILSLIWLSSFPTNSWAFFVQQQAAKHKVTSSTTSLSVSSFSWNVYHDGSNSTGSSGSWPQQQQHQPSFTSPPQPSQTDIYHSTRTKEHFGKEPSGMQQQRQQMQYQQQYRSLQKAPPRKQSEEVSKYDAGKHYMIPVLGPFPDKPTTLLGGEFVLSAPTPVQWKTIMECVDVHDVALKNLKVNGTYAANLDAAPVVAILENDPSATDRSTSATRYATLAAIVGVTSLEHFLDTSDAIRFRDSLQRIRTASSTFFTPDSKVRMVGVGRAQLSHFGTKNKDAIIPNPTTSPSAEQDTVRGDSEPILMARLRVLLDQGVASTMLQQINHHRDTTDQGKQLQQESAKMARARKMGEMSLWASRINSLHVDRQKLVRGLQAAETRLQDAASKEWEDFDGIGDFYNTKDEKAEAELQAPSQPPMHEQQEQQQQPQEPQDEAALMAAEQARREAIEAELARMFALEHPRVEPNQPPPSMEDAHEPGRYSPDSAFQEKINELLSIFENELYDAGATTFNRNPSTTLSLECSNLLNLPNYGMGYSETSFAPLDTSTKEFVERLRPYYSYEQSNTEEFYYSTYSFVALHSLQTFLLHKLGNNVSSPPSMELLHAMKCTDTAHRLKQVYEWMFQHTSLLHQLAKAKSQELRQCGQECTDLW